MILINKNDIKKGHPHHEISSIIKSALIRDARIAGYKKKKYGGICKRFEEKYNLSSDVFMDKWGSGKLDDRDDFFDWFAAKKGFDIWIGNFRYWLGSILELRNKRKDFLDEEIKFQNIIVTFAVQAGKGGKIP